MLYANSIDIAIVERLSKDTGLADCDFLLDGYDFTQKSLREIVGSSVFNNPLFILKLNAEEDRTNNTPRITYFSEDRDIKRDKGVCDFYIEIAHQTQDFVDSIAERIGFLLSDPYHQRSTTRKIVPQSAIIGVIRLQEEVDGQSQAGKIFLKRLKFEIRFARK